MMSSNVKKLKSKLIVVLEVMYTVAVSRAS